MSSLLRIGTRGSKLALAQTGLVSEAVVRAAPGVQIEQKIIQTSGDWKPSHGETRLAESEGGKGLFAREIENELLASTIDCGVHSLKDLPAVLPHGLVISQVLKRADPRDAFLCDKYKSLADLPAGSTIGTASLRRQAFILEKRPDLKIAPLRGNVPTRIEKMRAGQIDAIILAAAGLDRLGLSAEIKEYFPEEDFIPAGGQGVIAIETRAGDTKTHAALDGINCAETFLCITAERAALKILDASCRTPIGAYATLSGNTMTLRLQITQPDGSQTWKDVQSKVIADVKAAEAFGTDRGQTMKAVVPSSLLT